MESSIHSYHRATAFIPNRKGFSPVEALLAVTIFALISSAFIGAIISGREAMMISGKHARALMIAEEGLEATRNIRDEDFVLLTDGAHGISGSGSSWAFAGTSDVTDEFTRIVTIAPVNATTKSVTSTVSWQQNVQRNGSASLITYLTNWMLPDPPTGGDWSIPIQTANINISGNQDGWKLRTVGNYVYAVRLTGTPNFVVIDITNPDIPTLVGSLALTGDPLGIAVSGNYAYVPSSNNSKELIIVNITTPSAPSEVGSYNAPGNADARAAFVVGSNLYLTRVASASDEFLSFSLATPAVPSFLGSTNLGVGTNYDLFVRGSYAYVVSTDNNEELRIVNISTPATPIFTTSYNMPTNSNTFCVTGSGSNLFVGRQNGEMRIVNITTPTAPTSISVYNAGDAIRDIAFDAVNNYAFLATDVNSSEFQVIDLSSLASPVLLGSLDLTSDLNGIVYSTGSDRVYAIGENNTEEFVVFAPQ